ncbi:MAG: TrmO family methyltransferase [Coprobacillaceae bacterium]
MRPNLIAISNIQVKNIDYDKGIIYMYYIDAEDETPLLDIKPYIPSNDCIKTFQAPKWCAHWPKSYEESAEFDWDKEFTEMK